MKTRGTVHKTMNEFADARAEAAPGRGFVYAVGDIAFSAVYSPELKGLRALAWQGHESGLGCLTQRRLPDARFIFVGACFEYIFTPRPQKAEQ